MSARPQHPDHIEPQPPTSPPAAVPAPLVGALAGRYRIARELGSGGMATVYLAHDLRHDRDVAIKVLDPDVGAALGSDRFVREVHLAARLNHPHILPVYDSGEAGGFLYFVMPAMEGLTLRDRLAAPEPIPLDEATRIASELADALDYAHRFGVVHRDVKPENVLLHEGHALLADFGIGKAVAAAPAADTLTSTGIIIGTPAYMSPEQAAGHPVDGRSDLFALGCVLYEMLAGVQPFAGTTVQETLARRFVQPPPDVSALRPAVPSAIGRTIQRLLSVAPADRPATGAQVIEALRGAGRHESAVPGDRSIAVLAFANMSRDPEDEFFSDGISEEVINALTRLDGLRVAARTSAFSFKGRDVDLRTIGERLNVRHVLEGSVRRSGNRLRITAQLIDVATGYHHWSERFDRELTDVFAIQDEIAAAIAARFEVTLGRAGGPAPTTDNLDAYQLFLKGRALVNQRGPSLRLGVECLQRAVALDPDFAPALAALANALTLLCIYGALRPVDALPHARAAAARAIDRAPDLAEARMASALLAACDGERELAKREWERAVALGPANVELLAARALWDLAYLRGAFDAALEAGRHAVEGDPLSAYARALHALLYAHAGRPADGLPVARRAVELDPSAFLSQLVLMRLLFYSGLYDEAVSVGERAATATGRHVWIVGELAMGYARAGRRREAEALYGELVARPPDSHVEHIWLAAVAEWIGRRSESLEHLRRAAERGEPLFRLAGEHGFYLFVPRWESLPEYRELLERLPVAAPSGSGPAGRQG